MLNILTITDWIVIILFLQYLHSGWKRGLFRSSIGLIALGVSSIFGIIYFDLSKNMIVAMGIVLSGTVIVTVALWFMHAVGRATVEKEYRDYTLLPSRLLGSLVSVFWQGSITILFLLLLTLMPFRIFGLEWVQQDIYASKSYLLIHEHVISKTPFVRNIINITSLFKDPSKLEEISETKEFQDFFLNEKVVNLLSDERLMTLAKDKQFHQFVSDPKIVEIINDDELMKKLTKLSKRIYIQQKSGETQAGEE